MPADAAARPAPGSRAVAVVTLGCARNEVDSEELAGRLERDGWRIVDDTAEADAVLVNTCGFIEAAKKDSIDALLAAADAGTGRPRAVVAVGCLAERYGEQLAAALPEADAVLGFDDYEAVGTRLETVLRGGSHVAHAPRDRRRLLPLAPVDRPAVPLPAHLSRPPRRRLTGGPVAPLKIASGCDRRCTFCAIPAFRGAYLSRRPADVVAEAGWLAAEGVREVVLVSENTTSYGKDLADPRALETLLAAVAAVPGLRRVRASYLQPAEMRPSLVGALCATPGVAAYFDLSFQHASARVLRRMRRFGDGEQFLALLEQVRDADPRAGVRSNLIVGFPGETEADVAVLDEFLEAARLDAVGVFGYSDEEGTEAETYDGKLSEAEVRGRVEHVTALAEELAAQRAEDRIGEEVAVLVESAGGGAGQSPAVGRAAHQGPEVDGCVSLHGAGVEVAAMVRARVTGAAGVDLDAQVLEVLG